MTSQAIARLAQVFPTLLPLAANTRSLIPNLERRLALALNRLAVLLAMNPGALDEELSNTVPIPVEPNAVATNLPANLLRQRPDIRTAERRLAAQTARIGVATAELYPKFSLTGFLGLQAVDCDSAEPDRQGPLG